MQTDPNHTAFPVSDRSFPDSENGLTKREYFALHLTAAKIAAGSTSIEIAVDRGINAADALIEALNAK